MIRFSVIVHKNKFGFTDIQGYLNCCKPISNVARFRCRQERDVIGVYTHIKPWRTCC